jgi:Cyclin, N-terminal domain
MAQFAGSTQQTQWLMSEEQVSARRAAAVLHKRPAEAALTLHDEAVLRRHHERRILRFCTRVGFPDKVGATAVAYFKRFYLNRSVLDHNPAVIALNALYAASKVEEVIMSAEELVAAVDRVLNGIGDPDANPAGEAATESADGTAARVDIHMLLRDELPFLSLLNFHLICFHPYRSLRVLRAQISADSALPTLVDEPDSRDDTAADDACAASPATPPSPLETLMARAARIAARRTFLSDLQFTSTPAVVACACVVCAAEELEMKGSGVAAAAVAACVERELDPGGLAAVRRAAAAVRTMQEGGIASDEAVRELEARRRALCDPLKDPTSEVFKQRLGEEEEAVEVKRRKKMQESTAEAKARTEELMGFVDNG